MPPLIFIRFLSCKWQSTETKEEPVLEINKMKMFLRHENCSHSYVNSHILIKISMESGYNLNSFLDAWISTYIYEYLTSCSSITSAIVSSDWNSLTSTPNESGWYPNDQHRQNQRIHINTHAKLKCKNHHIYRLT